MGMSLPVIAFDVPGVNDVLDGGNPGLVPFGDTVALAHRIAEVLDEPGRRDELGAESRRNFEKAFEIGGYVRRIGDLYRDLLSPQIPAENHAELG